MNTGDGAADAAAADDVAASPVSPPTSASPEFIDCEIVYDTDRDFHERELVFQTGTKYAEAGDVDFQHHLAFYYAEVGLQSLKSIH